MCLLLCASHVIIPSRIPVAPNMVSRFDGLIRISTERIAIIQATSKSTAPQTLYVLKSNKIPVLHTDRDKPTNTRTRTIKPISVEEYISNIIEINPITWASQDQHDTHPANSCLSVEIYSKIQQETVAPVTPNIDTKINKSAFIQDIKT